MPSGRLEPIGRVTRASSASTVSVDRLADQALEHRPELRANRAGTKHEVVVDHQLGAVLDARHLTVVAQQARRGLLSNRQRSGSPRRVALRRSVSATKLE